MKPPIDGGTILITGASAGIGREMARQLAPRADEIAITARRQNRLEELEEELESQHEVSVLPISCDLLDKDETDEMIRTVEDEFGTVDVLINNAGMGYVGLFQDSNWEENRKTLRLNIESLTYLTHRLLDPMIEQGSGGILNVSSGNGMFYIPGATTYSGTKHFVTSFSDSLRMELEETGVVVSQLCPGPVDTEFQDQAGMTFENSIPEFLFQSAEDCARVGINGFSRGKALIASTWTMKFLFMTGGLIPRGLYRLMMKIPANLFRKNR